MDEVVGDTMTGVDVVAEVIGVLDVTGIVLEGTAVEVGRAGSR